MAPVRMPVATDNKGLCVWRNKCMMFSFRCNLQGFMGGNLLFPGGYLNLLACFCTSKSGKNSLRSHLCSRELCFFP